MAYVAQQIPEEEQNQFGNKNPSTAFPAVPPQTGGSSGSGQNAAPGFASSSQFGSNAAKLSDYLKANQDQASQFGQQVAGNLNQGFGQTQGAVDTGVQNFNQQVNQGWNQPDYNQINAAAANPTDFASNPNNVQQFQGWYNDQYTGPQNFESTQPYSDINNQVNQAVQNAASVGTPAGLGTYLNSQMNAQDYTPGMQTLDTALLMGNPQSAQAIQAAAAPYSGLTNYLSGQTQAADANVPAAQAQAAQTAQQVQNQFNGSGGVIPSFEQNLNNQVSNAQNTAQANTTEIQNALASGNISQLSPADLASLGITPQQASTLSTQEGLLNTPANLQKIFAENPIPAGAPSWESDLRNSIANEFVPNFSGINFNQSGYATPINASNDPNVSNVANANDYAEAAALQQLTGQNLGGFLNPANSGQAGTAPTELLNYNAPGAIQDSSNLYQGILNGIGGNTSGWNQYFNAIQQQANGGAPANSDALISQALSLKQQSGQPLTPEEQQFINFYQQQNQKLAGVGLGAL